MKDGVSSARVWEVSTSQFDWVAKVAKLSVEKRRAFVKENRQCFNCFKGGHVSSACKSKTKCEACCRRHHSLFHGTFAQEEYKQPSSLSQVNLIASSVQSARSPTN